MFHNFLLLLLLIIIIIITIIIILFACFSHQRYQVIFHSNLSDNKSPQISRTLLSILANLNNGLNSSFDFPFF